MLGRGHRWNVTDAEHAASYPCDLLVPPPRMAMTRAIDVAAPASAVWPWLGQLRVAPYSYDSIDNLGRESPQRIDRSAPPLAPGQRILVMFEVVAVVPGESFTAESNRDGASRVFGHVATTYAVTDTGRARSRIVARIVSAGGTPLRRAANAALAVGDVVMVRRQLLNLAALAEGSGARIHSATART